MNDVATSQTSRQAFRLLHTMIRVKDLDKSIDFYTRLLGMKLMRRKDYPSGEFTLAFVGYGDEADQAVIELTHNWGQEDLCSPYDKNHSPTNPAIVSAGMSLQPS